MGNKTLAISLVLVMLAAFSAMALLCPESGQPQQEGKSAVQADQLDTANQANAWQEDEHMPEDIMDNNL